MASLVALEVKGHTCVNLVRSVLYNLDLIAFDSLVIFHEFPQLALRIF